MNKHAEFGRYIAKLADNDLLHLNAMVNPRANSISRPGTTKDNPPPPTFSHQIPYVANKPITARTDYDNLLRQSRSRLFNFRNNSYRLGLPPGTDLSHNGMIGGAAGNSLYGSQLINDKHTRDDDYTDPWSLVAGGVARGARTRAEINNLVPEWRRTVTPRDQISSASATPNITPGMVR